MKLEKVNPFEWALYEGVNNELSQTLREHVHKDTYKVLHWQLKWGIIDLWRNISGELSYALEIIS